MMFKPYLQKKSTITTPVPGKLQPNKIKKVFEQMLTSIQDIKIFKILTRHPIVLEYHHTKFRDSSYTRIVKSHKTG